MRAALASSAAFTGAGGLGVPLPLALAGGLPALRPVYRAPGEDPADPGTGLPPNNRPGSKSQGCSPWNSWNESFEQRPGLRSAPRDPGQRVTSADGPGRGETTSPCGVGLLELRRSCGSIRRVKEASTTTTIRPRGPPRGRRARPRRAGPGWGWSGPRSPGSNRRRRRDGVSHAGAATFGPVPRPDVRGGPVGRPSADGPARRSACSSWWRAALPVAGLADSARLTWRSVVAVTQQPVQAGVHERPGAHVLGLLLEPDDLARPL